MSLLRISRPNIDEDAVSAAVSVLRSGNLVYGEIGKRFERELASFVGTSEAIVVSSGTAALYLALKALGIGQGDAVLVPGFTFPATANSVVIAGARPVIVDVDPYTYCMTPEAAEAAISKNSGKFRLTAILLVHEFGTPCDMPHFRSLAKSHGLRLIEDAACALGAYSKCGMIGKGSDVACFSFHPRKTLTTGEGGALLTDDTALADRLRSLRNHGIIYGADGVSFVEPALNFRLTDIQSSLGLSQLPHLKGWISTRQKLVSRYISRLSQLEQQNMLSLPATIEGQSWQTFMIVLNERFNRSEVIAVMREKGFETNAGAQSLSNTLAYERFAESDDLAVARCLGRQGLALPLCEQMSLEDVDRVAASLSQVLDNAAA